MEFVIASALVSGAAGWLLGGWNTRQNLLDACRQNILDRGKIVELELTIAKIEADVESRDSTIKALNGRIGELNSEIYPLRIMAERQVKTLQADARRKADLSVPKKTVRKPRKPADKA